MNALENVSIYIKQIELSIQL